MMMMIGNHSIALTNPNDACVKLGTSQWAIKAFQGRRLLPEEFMHLYSAIGVQNNLDHQGGYGDEEKIVLNNV